MPTYADEVLPTHDDALVAGGSEVAGGVAGARLRLRSGWWTPVRVLVVLAALAVSVGYLAKAPCHGSEFFRSDVQYTHLCYSDIPPLYQLRGFAHGFLPYVQTDPQGEGLEYPVLTGAFMLVASWLTGTDGSDSLRALRFYDWNVLLLSVCLLVTVVCTALTVRRRPWDAALVALAPGVVLAAFINWDLLAVALTAGFVLAWTRRRTMAAGLLLGLAVAAKFYPVLLLGPLWLVAWRQRRWREAGATTAWAGGIWLAVNLPVYVANPDGWKHFYSFSAERGADWGSFWYFLQIVHHGVAADSLNKAAFWTLVALCAGIAVLAAVARPPARFAQLAFLVIAAFCLTNKVYSPQYVLWLIPFAALARPRWRDFLIWQAGEVVYFVAIWVYLEGYGDAANRGIPEGWYAAAIATHIVATLYFAGMVVRDVLVPRHDPLLAERLEDAGQSSPTTASNEAVVIRTSHAT